MPALMQPVALAGIASALALLVGATACLCMPALPPGWLCMGMLAVGVGALCFDGIPRLAGWGVIGFAWLALHGQWMLAAQLPVASEGHVFTVSGQVADLPDPQQRRTRFLLRADGTAPAAVRGRLLQLDWYDGFGVREAGLRVHLHAGESWRLKVKLRAPRGLANPGPWDVERTLLARRIVATGYVTDPDDALRLMSARGVDAWRERMSARIARSVPAASSRFVRALALGDTHALADEDWEKLRADGLTHLIAISGSHVGMVAGFFAVLVGGAWRLLPRIGHVTPRPVAMAWAALLGGLAYAAVAGFGLPTMRTVLMIAVVALARASRRSVRVADALALALMAVLLADPLSVMAAGFWLSFAGVAWLAWCLPGRDGQKRGLLHEFLSAQGVATVGLLPLTVMLFGQASLAGPLANLLAIPVWSLVVVPLALSGLLAEVLWPGGGGVFWRWAAQCFDLTWPVFEWLASSRFALWWLPEAAWSALPLALCGALWLLLPRGVPGKPLACLLWLPLLWPARHLPARGEAELLVMDVGQGLAVLVRTATHVLVYDTGPAVEGGFDAGERVVLPAMQALGSGRADRIVVSHADADHAGGLAALRRSMPRADVLAPPQAPVTGAAACEAGAAWQWDGVRFRFLHPSPGFPYLRNESSCVLRIETAHGTALLTGDIGEAIEHRLLRGRLADLHADIVLVPHHGSGAAADPGFIAATGARLALVSAGHGNRFGHPRADVVRRWRAAGAEVLNTADSGALRVWFMREGLHVREQRRWRARWWDAAGRVRATAILSTDD
jgi:competence protein ComEC